MIENEFRLGWTKSSVLTTDCNTDGYGNAFVIPKPCLVYNAYRRD